MSDVPSVPARPVLTGETERFLSLREFEQRIFTLQQQITEQIRGQRELVESRAEALEKALGAQRELVDTRSEALDKALDIRTAEIARRLEELNHAHRNQQENWRQSLPREVFETTISELSKWRDQVNAHTTSLTNLPQHIAGMEARVKTIENLGNKITGALILLGVMGMAGVMALVISLLRLAGLINP